MAGWKMPVAKARRKPLESGSADTRKAHARSRVSNGRDILPNADGRSLISKRYREIASAVASQQSASDLSEVRQQLIRRFAAASVLAEQLEARLANGERIDVSEHALLVSTCVRIAGRIGVAIHRRSKSVPTLAEYLASQRESEDAEDDAEVAREAAE
jgi:hypothetical protein